MAHKFAGKKREDIAVEVGKSVGLFTNVLKASGKRVLKAVGKASRRAGPAGLFASMYLDKNISRAERRKQAFAAQGIRPLIRGKKK